MNLLDYDYQHLLKTILNDGVVKGDRTGTGTKSVFGKTIRHKMSHGFPLLTTKKISFKTIVTELIWFLRGETNIKYLVDNNCNIWNGDAYKRYTTLCSSNDSRWNTSMKYDPASNTYSMYTMDEFKSMIKTSIPFANEWGELGPIYGKQWRNWESYVGAEVNEGTYEMTKVSVDQIKSLIHDLKNNPDSRRLMVNAWNVPEIPYMALPPCHFGFQCYTRELTYKERYKVWFENNYEKGMEYNEENVPDFDNNYYDPTPTRALSLKWNQRSVDTFLGLPYNIASYGLLLLLLAKECNMLPEDLVGDLGDTHLYLNHLDQANTQILNKPFELPRVKIVENANILNLNISDILLMGYQSHDVISAPLSN